MGMKIKKKRITPSGGESDTGTSGTKVAKPLLNQNKIAKPLTKQKKVARPLTNMKKVATPLTKSSGNAMPLKPQTPVEKPKKKVAKRNPRMRTR